jgi:hypothetical protein
LLFVAMFAKLGACLVAVSHADSRTLFAPAYTPGMTVQMAPAPAVVQPMEYASPYVQPVQYVQPAEYSQPAPVWPYALAGALLVGAAGAVNQEGVAMLFGSGKKAAPKKAVKKAAPKRAVAKKVAPKKVAPKKVAPKKTAVAAPDSDGLFVHSGTPGFSGAQGSRIMDPVTRKLRPDAWVYRAPGRGIN